MINQILEDAFTHPQIFLWCGALDREKLDRWKAPNQVEIPLDLIRLWSVTGGGEMFETEALLSPFATDPEYDITAKNNLYWESGIDKELLVFHCGTWISAVRNASPHFTSFKEHDSGNQLYFQTVDAWYRETLRQEYQKRYGLSELPFIGSNASASLR